MNRLEESGGSAANGRLNLVKLMTSANVNLSGHLEYFRLWFSRTKSYGKDKNMTHINMTFRQLFFFGYFLERPITKILMYFGYFCFHKIPDIILLDPDITLKASLDELQSNEEKEELKKIAQEVTKKESINFSNIRKNKSLSNM